MPCAGDSAQGCVCSVAQHTPGRALCATCSARSGCEGCEPHGTVCGDRAVRGAGCGCGSCRIILCQVDLKVQCAKRCARAMGTGVPAFRRGKRTCQGHLEQLPPCPPCGWEIQPWQAGGGTWCSAEAELSGAGTSWPRDPREILAQRRLLAAAAVPSGSPFSAPCQHWGDKGGSCSWQGAEKGLLEERHCCLPATSLQKFPRLPSMGALGSATARQALGRCVLCPQLPMHVS